MSEKEIQAIERRVYAECYLARIPGTWWRRLSRWIYNYAKEQQTKANDSPKKCNIDPLLEKLKTLQELSSKATQGKLELQTTAGGKLVWEQRRAHGEASTWLSKIRIGEPGTPSFKIVCDLDFGYGRKGQEADAEFFVEAVNFVREYLVKPDIGDRR